MRRERGVGLIELAIWAGLLLAAGLAISKAWETFVAEPYRAEGFKQGAQAQLAIDQPKINQAQQQAQANLARAQTAEAAYALQNQKLLDGEKITADAQTAARAANAKYAAEVAKNAKRDAERKADAEGPPPAVAVTCEQELKLTADILRDSAVAQQGGSP